MSQGRHCLGSYDLCDCSNSRNRIRCAFNALSSCLFTFFCKRTASIPPFSARDLSWYSRSGL